MTLTKEQIDELNDLYFALDKIVGEIRQIKYHVSEFIDREREK